MMAEGSIRTKDKMCHRGSDVIRDGANLAGVTSNGLSGGSSSLFLTIWENERQQQQQQQK